MARSARLTLPALIGSGSLALLAMTASLPLALAAMWTMGFAQPRLVVGVQSLLQLRTPEELRGRVMAVFTQVLLGGIPLGAILSGSLAAVIGASMTWIAAAFAAASVAIVIGFRITLSVSSRAASTITTPAAPAATG